MRFHAQNLNEKPGGIVGSMWREGRCWLHTKRWTFGFSWHFWNKRLGLKVGLADYDHALCFSIQTGLVNLYLNIDNRRLYDIMASATKRSDQQYTNGRVIGFYVFEGAVHIQLWNDPMEHRRSDPRWWSIYFSPKDILLGKTQYSEELTKTVRVEIPMPERNYPGTVKLFVSTWKRSRWPWPLQIARAEIVPDTPIPFPGKGENSWDCGEDATHALTCQASNEQQAVAALVKSVLDSRYRHGGREWRPARAKA